ncbi:MAG: glycoside hydrolase family 32 protein [Candidatus Solibacter sp.]
MKRRQFVGMASAAAMQVSAAQAQTDPTLAKATQAVLEAVPVAEADPDRPVYHFRPPANWTNDPNGTIFYKGWHHLFYQLNPFSTRLGSQHWGHARSRDLVNWEHLPIAIWPSEALGERAIFSGGAMLAGDGRPRIIYTSIGKPQPEQWMVIPKDDELLSWEKYRGNPVLAQEAHAGGPIAQWRDPFMFRKDGVTYMVVGGGTGAGRAQVQLYRAAKPDLTEWRHMGGIFQALDRDVRNFECPNLFPLDGKWVMIVSPNRVCEYWIGDLDIGKMQFLPSAHGVLDAGDAYASNISVDDKARTILWLWGRTNTPQGKGWASVIAMPRILSIGPDGYLRQRPAPEFETLRGTVKTFGATALDKPYPLEGVATDCAEIEAEFSGTGTYGLELRKAADGKPGIVVSMQGNYLNVGAARAFVGNAERHRLRIFLDKRSIEVYADDGATALYNWVDAGQDALGISVFGQAAAGRGSPQAAGGLGGPPPPALVTNRQPPRLEALKMWPLRSARFSMERFKA